MAVAMAVSDGEVDGASGLEGVLATLVGGGVGCPCAWVVVGCTIVGLGEGDGEFALAKAGSYLGIV